MKINKKLLELLVVSFASIFLHGSELSLEKMSQKGMLLRGWDTALHDSLWLTPSKAKSMQSANERLSQTKKITQQNRAIARATKTVEETEDVGFIITKPISYEREILSPSIFNSFPDDIKKSPSCMRIYSDFDDEEVGYQASLRLSQEEKIARQNRPIAQVIKNVEETEDLDLSNIPLHRGKDGKASKPNNDMHQID